MIRRILFVLVGLLPLLISVYGAQSKVVIDYANTLIEAEITASPPHRFSGAPASYSLDIVVDSESHEVTSAEFSFQFVDFSTGVKKRDAKMLRWMESDNYPDAKFELTRVDETGEGKVAVGKFTMHGFEKEILIPFNVDTESDRFDEPVLILSARNSVGDRVDGLNLGADDYLPKPFSFEELLARVRSLLSRHASGKKTILEHCGIRMDLLGRQVTYEGTTVNLTNREYALLELLMSNIGRTLTRTQIGEKIWEAHYDMQTNLIDVYVRKLRQHFASQEDEQPLIRTVRSVGYVMQ